MNAQVGDPVGMSQLAAIKDAGYDYVELPLAQTVGLSDDDYAVLLRKLRSLNLPCLRANNFFPVDMKLTGPLVDTEAIRGGYVAKALHRAHEMGIETVVFGSGPAKMVPDGFSLENGYVQLVDLLKQVGPIAEKEGIEIAIEPLRKAECNLINTFEEGCRLSDDAGHPAVKVLVDFYHLDVEKEPVGNIVKYGKTHLIHTHFAEPQGRLFPRLANSAYYRSFFEALRDIGYEGTMSVEGYSMDFNNEVTDALKALKAVCNQVN